jgi:hypothetical protein
MTRKQESQNATTDIQLNENSSTIFVPGSKWAIEDGFIVLYTRKGKMFMYPKEYTPIVHSRIEITNGDYSMQYYDLEINGERHIVDSVQLDRGFYTGKFASFPTTTRTKKDNYAEIIKTLGNYSTKYSGFEEWGLHFDTSSNKWFYIRPDSSIVSSKNSIINAKLVPTGEIKLDRVLPLWTSFSNNIKKGKEIELEAYEFFKEEWNGEVLTTLAHCARSIAFSVISENFSSGYGLVLEGATRSGKTTVGKIGLSLVQPFSMSSMLFAKFNDTITMIEKQAAMYQCVPFLLDDLVDSINSDDRTVKENNKKIDAIMRSVSEHTAVRKRSSITGKSQKEYIVNTLPIFSVERLRDFDMSLFNRVFVIQVECSKNNRERLAMETNLYKYTHTCNYWGSLLQTYIVDKLNKNGMAKFAEELRKKYEEYFIELSNLLDEIWDSNIIGYDYNSGTCKDKLSHAAHIMVGAYLLDTVSGKTNFVYDIRMCILTNLVKQLKREYEEITDKGIGPFTAGIIEILEAISKDVPFSGNKYYCELMTRDGKPIEIKFPNGEIVPKDFWGNMSKSSKGIKLFLIGEDFILIESDSKVVLTRASSLVGYTVNRLGKQADKEKMLLSKKENRLDDAVKSNGKTRWGLKVDLLKVLRYFQPDELVEEIKTDVDEKPVNTKLPDIESLVDKED